MHSWSNCWKIFWKDTLLVIQLSKKSNQVDKAKSIMGAWKDVEWCKRFWAELLQSFLDPLISCLVLTGLPPVQQDILALCAMACLAMPKTAQRPSNLAEMKMENTAQQTLFDYYLDCNPVLLCTHFFYSVHMEHFIVFFALFMVINLLQFGTLRLPIHLVASVSTSTGHYPVTSPILWVFLPLWSKYFVAIHLHYLPRNLSIQTPRCLPTPQVCLSSVEGLVDWLELSHLR